MPCYQLDFQRISYFAPCLQETTDQADRWSNMSRIAGNGLVCCITDDPLLFHFFFSVVFINPFRVQIIPYSAYLNSRAFAPVYVMDLNPVVVMISLSSTVSSTVHKNSQFHIHIFIKMKLGVRFSCFSFNSCVSSVDHCHGGLLFLIVCLICLFVFLVKTVFKLICYLVRQQIVSLKLRWR